MTRLLTLLFLFPVLVFAQNRGIKIFLNSGDVISTNYAMIHETGLGGPFVKIDEKNGKRFPIREVEHIEGIDQDGEFRYFMPVKVSGFTLWGERIIQSDRITVYYTNVRSGGWGTNYKMQYYVYSKDGGPVRKMKHSNLIEDLSDNPESLEHLKVGNALSITQGVLYIGGAALLAVGIKQMSDDLDKSVMDDTETHIPPAFIVGLATYYVPFFMQGAKQDRFLRALESYK